MSHGRVPISSTQLGAHDRVVAEFVQAHDQADLIRHRVDVVLDDRRDVHSLASSVMQKLNEWKVRIPKDESDAYLHLWQVTAHMLGVYDEYIPVSWEQAELQRQQVLVPLLARTDEGVKLADMLVNLGQYIDFHARHAAPLDIPTGNNAEHPC